MTRNGTRILLTFIDRLNVWLRFGRPRAERILDAHRRVLEFAPGSLCCRVRWRANEYGTDEWQLIVIQTGAPGEPIERIRGVAPGAILLLRVTGARYVPSVLALIDRIEALGIDPPDSSPDYWRVLHQRLCTRAELPEYGRARHDAYLMRERLK